MATARKLPSGSWRCLAYDYTDTQGKRCYKSFTADTKSRAERLAADYACNKSRDSAHNGNLTLLRAITGYCDSKNNVLSPSTLREYRRMCGNYYGRIINLQLKNISNDVIQQWVNAFAATHAPKTVSNAYGLIAAVLDTYMPDLHLHVTLPQRITPELYVPSDSDLKAILAFLQENDTILELAVYFAAFGTLRRSEICALETSDICGNILHVNKAMVDAGANKWVIKTTKTISSTRHVQLPDFVIAKCPKKGRLVPINPDQITRRFERALTKVGVNHFRFHDLRHYAASIMHAIGVPDQYIMQRGGWSSDRTLKSIYRGTIADFEKRYTDMTTAHFENMQHEMQHKKIKPQ